MVAVINTPMTLLQAEPSWLLKVDTGSPWPPLQQTTAEAVAQYSGCDCLHSLHTAGAQAELQATKSGTCCFLLHAHCNRVPTHLLQVQLIQVIKEAGDQDFAALCLLISRPTEQESTVLLFHHRERSPL